MPAGTLFVLATPLGNLQDITLRALEVLGKAAIVACEDTRRTRVLLEHFGIHAPRVISCHKFNERRQIQPILSALREGKNVALVSDGGTPCLSDPGSLAVQAALEQELPVSPIPGPSAVAAAMSASGFAASSFVFVGFLPRPAGQRRCAIQALRDEARPLLLFEAPHRVASTVEDLLALLGDRPVTLLRELTKVHEEVRRTTLGSLGRRLAGENPRGEFTLVVQGRTAAREKAAAEPVNRAELRRRYGRLILEGVDRREALKALVRETGLPRQEVYAAVRSP